jgi:uncharacterized Tic20 family protein
LPKQDKTLIHGYFGMHPLVILFLFIWFGGLLGVGIFATVAGESNIISLFFIWFFIIIFLIVGLMIVAIGKLLSGDDYDRILYFIETTLNVDDKK